MVYSEEYVLYVGICNTITFVLQYILNIQILPWKLESMLISHNTKIEHRSSDLELRKGILYFTFMGKL